MFFSAWISINTWEMPTSFHNGKVDIFYLLVMITRKYCFPFATRLLAILDSCVTLYKFLLCDFEGLYERCPNGIIGPSIRIELADLTGGIA
ncbi:hypothetical protein I7I48_10806 [Histoplasma ohiense]|nr:hypothetical protein I7I48_10806 [Histoplasma ohiense (nom. inval.)]